MVDFNNETTVSTPAADIVRVLILERHAYVVDAIERHYVNDALNIDTAQDLGVIKARLMTFYFYICEVLPRRMDKDEIKNLKEDLAAEDFDGVMRAFRSLNKVLDSVKLTRIDTKKVYDPTRVEEENKEKGI